ncbi:MAG: glycoside hydrolase family 127 protein [Lentisphaeria bacterium]|nr:glycoside hydrolase family 127 protein [Lentisphaeria bacterium]
MNENMNGINHKLHLEGPLGKAGKLVLQNYLKDTSFTDLAAIFHTREENDNGWRCEFWGKILRGAILLNAHLRDPEMEKIIDETVADILDSQKEDGSITSYPTEKQLQGWNLWGIKYVLLALLRYVEYGGKKEKIIKACTTLLSYVEEIMAKDGHFFPDYGLHTGLAVSSMLGAVVKVWDLTDDIHWKELAEKLILSGCSTANNIFAEAEKGTLPACIGNGKAYELTSCFQGLAEYIITAEKRNEKYLQDKDYKEICFKYFRLICDNEIMITGASGLKDVVGEFWDQGKYKQHLSNAGSLGETCIMTTLLHYADRMISLAGEKHIEAAELAEKILYNALLGAMTPDGRNFTHANPTPLTGGGWKQPAPDQMLLCFKKAFHGHDCCRAQGPEGLAMAYPLALRILKKQDKISGCVINLYEKMKFEFPGSTLGIDGDYPYGAKVKIKLKTREDFSLSLRIPQYTEKVVVDGQTVSFIPGDYLELTAPAKTEKEVELFFDLALKEIPAPGDPSYIALRRGALILAEDSRQDAVTDAKLHEIWQGHHLVEYASAGNAFSENNTLQVFFKTGR